MSNEELIQRLRAVVIRHLGNPGHIHKLRRLTGGANKTTWFFRTEINGQQRPFILQLASPGWTDLPPDLLKLSSVLTPDQDARYMMVAASHGVPAPRVCAILDTEDALGDGYITEFVEGESLAPRILRDQRFAHARNAMTGQCARILAAIHSIPTSEVPFLTRLDAKDQLAAQRKLLDHFDVRHPAFELSLRWMEENLPRSQRQTTVHGDFRLGNFIVGEEGIRLVLDWELGHVGDPMEDLGWLCVKTWRFGGKHPVGGFGSRDELFKTYEKATGYEVDPRQVRFWEALGNLRWAIICLRMGVRGKNEADIERCAIGRRIEEPLWDLLNLVEKEN